MLNKYISLSFLITMLVVTSVVTSCKKEEEPQPVTNITNITTTNSVNRARVEYSTLTATTLYDTTFVNETGDTTVDRNDGRALLNMARGLSAYAGTATSSANAQLDSAVYENMFANKNGGFTGAYAYLNSSLLNLRNITSSSKTAAIANEVRYDFSVYFGKMAKVSTFRNATADGSNAGVLLNGSSKYLVDSNGIEWAQLIQKSMIGATLLDYIGNKLLDKGLNANNTTLVLGKNYTQLEHNWDVAYGLLTNKARYGMNANDLATPPTSGGEALLGSYVWEYNRANYSKIHLAFLKGRAAIVNNDKTELKAQADFIRKEFEKALAGAALGYLGKFKASGATDGARAHAMGEGAGFIYSLRFCKMHGADEAFSDKILDDLKLFKADSNGIWDLTNDQINAASDAIKAKFGL